MKHVVPLFIEGHILRHEMLTALSDLAILPSQFQFEQYANGILCGCRLTTTSEAIYLSAGLVCFEKKIYVLREPLHVLYQATNVTHLCKLCFLDEVREANEICREIQLVIEEEPVSPDTEFEVCRFQLQQGAVLRYQYLDFEDRATEYDTLTTIYAPYAARGGSTLSPEIMRAFAVQMLAASGLTEFDVMFCVQVLNQSLPMTRDAIAAYLRHRRREPLDSTEPVRMYQYMAVLLGEAEHGEGSTASTQKQNRWKMMID